MNKNKKLRLSRKESLEDQFLKLLKKDEKFRLAIASYLGYNKISEKLDKYDKKFNSILEEIKLLREDQNKLWENQNRLWEEVRSLREDMIKGFELVERHISALGARWGLMSEEAFREGLKGLLEKELGLKVERWLQRDDKGIVYGYPSNVEIDISIKDKKTILIEVSSHIKASDVALFKRKIDFYISKTGEKVDRLLIVTPHADEDAIKASKEFGFEIYTKV